MAEFLHIIVLWNRSSTRQNLSRFFSCAFPRLFSLRLFQDFRLDCVQAWRARGQRCQLRRVSQVTTTFFFLSAELGTLLDLSLKRANFLR